MDNLIISTWPVLWAGLAVVLFFSAIYMIFATSWRWMGLVVLVLSLVFSAFWVHGSSHALVGINTIVLVEDVYTGNIVGEKRTPGVIEFTMFSSRIHTFPSQPRFEWCDEYHPPIGGSIAVILKPCLYINASLIDWKAQVARYHSFSAGEIFARWKNLVSQKIADSVHDLTAEQLSRQGETAERIQQAVAPALASEGVVVTGLVLPFWDFEDPEIAKAYDLAATAQTGKMRAQAEMEAAKVERETALFRVNTQNLVLEAQTSALQKVMDELRITDSRSRAEVLRLRLLIDYLATHPATTVVLTTGDGGVGIPASSEAK